MQPPPRIPESRRRGPNGRFLPRGPESGSADPVPAPTGSTPAEQLPTERVMTDIADIAATDEPVAPVSEAFEADTAPELPEDRFLNRELSWLDFNARVLALALDSGTPLLERAKFL